MTGRSRFTAKSGSALFVDDEPFVLDGIAAALHGRGFRILTANGPAEALGVLERETVAVVVSDEQMPRMCGTELLAEVRRRHPEVVRMVLSGSHDARAIARAVNEAGVFRYLMKPCTPEDLRLAVEQALEAHAARGAAPRPAVSSLSIDDVLGRLTVAMQPIYESEGGQLYGHEALMRLTGATNVRPDEVLGAAQGAGRLWELERAIRRIVATLIPASPAGSHVFVNLHPNSLLDPQLFTTQDPLAPHARSVVLEITERGSLEQVTDLGERIDGLRELGYRVAIDDMGSGYSGLTAFTAILPDFVKFDRELIRAVHTTPSKHKLVSSIATVCRELQVTTVAEGIEDPNDLREARAMGCSLLQGYLLGRPGDGFCRGPYDVAGVLVDGLSRL